MAPRKGKKRGSKERDEPLEGIRVLWNYNALMTFVFLFIFFVSDFAVLFSFKIEGIVARLVHLVYFLGFLLIIFGLTFHKKWVFNLILWCYYYWTANLFVTLLLSPTVQSPVAKSYLIVVAPLMLILLFVNLVIIWYMFEKRNNFPSLKGRNDLVDKVFHHVIVIFYLCIIFALLFSILGSIEISLAKDSMQGKDIDSCSKLGEDRSLCYVVTAEKTSNKEICYSIREGLHRFVCFSLVDSND